MREKKTASLATIIIVLMATTVTVIVSGCAGVFGLSDYSFDEAADSGGNETSTIDSPTTHTDASGDSSIDAGPAVPTCTDKILNQDETDIDCGGTICPKCPGKKQCVLARDCQSPLACVDELCLSPSSNDMEQDGTETDVDCGGTTAPTCKDGLMCKVADDCTSKVCDGTKLTCTPPSSTDKIQNGKETDVDCGGGTAPPCMDGKKCVNGTQDCMSLVCTNQVCKTATTTDGFKNGNETDVDCGGPSPDPKCIVGKACLMARDCFSANCTGLLCVASAPNNGVKDGTETDVDCGGGAAPACAAGKICLMNSDCSIVTSGVCTGGVCQAATSTDLLKNGNETDMDCGSSTTPGTATGAGKCGDNKKCIAATDCTNGVCNVTCQVPTSTDMVKNGNETDIDCGGLGYNGGAAAPACAGGKACKAAADCKSAICNALVCTTATASDNVQNGAETDIDCGGGPTGPTSAPPCVDTKGCGNGPRDCLSGVCSAGFKCMFVGADGAKNGNETDIDCGGADPTTNRCAAMQMCLVNSDCTSNSCNAGLTCD